MAVTRTRGRLAIASSVEVAEKLRGSTEFVPARVSLGSYEDEVFLREGVQFGPSLRRSAGCDALIAWRYSVQLQKSALMLLILFLLFTGLQLSRTHRIINSMSSTPGSLRMGNRQ